MRQPGEVRVKCTVRPQKVVMQSADA
jgi:hypothetical protein